MDYFSIILVIYLCYRNGSRAKRKEQNALLWGFVTGVAMFMGMVIGTLVVIYFFCSDIINIERFASNPEYNKVAIQQWQQALVSNPLHGLTIELFGIGGYLLIRYILERMPDKKEPDVHWMDRMDKMGSNEEV